MCGGGRLERFYYICIQFDGIYKCVCIYRLHFTVTIDIFSFHTYLCIICIYIHAVKPSLIRPTTGPTLSGPIRKMVGLGS